MRTLIYSKTLLVTMLLHANLFGVIRSYAEKTESSFSPKQIQCGVGIFLNNQPQGLEVAVPKLLQALQENKLGTITIPNHPDLPLQSGPIIETLKKKFAETKKENPQKVLCWEVLHDECRNSGVSINFRDSQKKGSYRLIGFIRMMEFIKEDVSRGILYFVGSGCEVVMD